MTSPLDAEDLRPRVQKVVDDFIAGHHTLLDGISDDLSPLVDAVSDLLGGGKRLRPAFCWWGYRGAGGPDTEEALRAECERLMQDKEAMAREMAEFREWEEITAPWPD